MVEDEQGNLTFHYNLTWGRVGARINGQLKAGNFSLGDIEAVVRANRLGVIAVVDLQGTAETQRHAALFF